MMINESFTYRCGNRVELYKPFFLPFFFAKAPPQQSSRYDCTDGLDVWRTQRGDGIPWSWVLVGNDNRVKFKSSKNPWHHVTCPFFQCITCFSGNHQPPSKIRLPLVAKELLPLLKWMLIPFLRPTAKALKHKREPKGKREELSSIQHFSRVSLLF